MKVRSRSRRRRKIWGRLLIFIVAAGAVIGLDGMLRPIVREVSASQTQIAVHRIIQQAVLEVLEEDDLRYQSFVTLQQNVRGETTALTTNTVQINRLQAQLLEKILDSLQANREMRVTLPLGTLLGSQFLAGRGPDVTLRLIPAGTVKTRIINQFDEAGINQTAHQIMMDVIIVMTILTPAGPESVRVVSSVVVAETVIVGNVPQSYVNVGE